MENWIFPKYLQNKDVIKICSFFNYNYGTISLENIEDKNSVKRWIETIDCPKNASSLQFCKFIDSK